MEVVATPAVDRVLPVAVVALPAEVGVAVALAAVLNVEEVAAEPAGRAGGPLTWS